MYNMFTKIFLMLLFISVVSGDSDCDNIKCPGLSKHYKELGCKPVKADDECCPSRYDCPNKANYASDNCRWNGNTYKVNEHIPASVISDICSASCYCAEGFPEGQPAEFRCAQIECGRLVGPDLDECITQSTFDSCCPRYICNEEEKKSIGTSKCELDGKISNAGEGMYPDSESCYKCICGADFDNSTIVDNPMCREITCGIELRYISEYLNGCIPTYYNEQSCCPSRWRCPQDNDVAIPAEKRFTGAPDLKAQCQFGKLTLNVGDEIKSVNEVCKCITPPMAYCIKKPN